MPRPHSPHLSRGRSTYRPEVGWDILRVVATRRCSECSSPSAAGASHPIRCRLHLHRRYTSLGFAGCSSHSGRRTFITRATHKVSEAGGSLRDVQQCAGHTNLAMTQRYIEGDTDAKHTLIGLM